jgi:hypothetical protein
MNYKNLADFDTNLTADVVEWRPISSINDHILLCGKSVLSKKNEEFHDPIWDIFSKRHILSRQRSQ